MDGQKLADIPELVRYCVPYPINESLSAQQQAETLRKQQNAHGGKQGLRRSLAERKSAAKLPDERAFWELVRIVFRDGVLGFFPSHGEWDKLVDHWVQQSWEAAKARSDYVGGLTLIVLCGIGRGVPYFVLDTPREGWRTEMISAPDLLTLSWLPDFKALSLWRILEAGDRLEGLGVGLHNFNGLVNLVGWARELGGHLVPHASLPRELGAASALVWVRQNSLRDVRHEALTQWDAHMSLHPSGEWRPVRRDEHSMFVEDRSRPFYMVDASPDGQWPQGVFESGSRRWWCILENRFAAQDAFGAVDRRLSFPQRVRARSKLRPSPSNVDDQIIVGS